MPFKDHGCEYDLVVFGATGYTGRLCAEHITTNLPTNLKWAVAGRSEPKLKKVVDDIKELNPDRVQPSIEVCDLTPTTLTALAKKTFVLITTVGPYSLYGEHAFKACAENGTHYLDVTGEVPWVARMIKKYDSPAKMTGAIMIPEIGLESAPSDLLAWSLARTNREQLNAKTTETVISLHNIVGNPSGGTLNTVLSIFDEFKLPEIKDATTPFAISPVQPEKMPKGPGLWTMVSGLRTVPNLGLLTTYIAGSSDSAIIGRSWGLMSTTKEAYGPNFHVSEYMKARNPLQGAVIHIGLAFAGLLLALVSPLRTLVRRYVYQPGEGAAKEDAAKDEFEYRGVAWPDLEGETGKEVKGVGKQAYARVVYHGSIYYFTGLLLAQAALTLLEDDLAFEGGVCTPSCLGQGFVDRLETVGFKIENKVVDVK